MVFHARVQEGICTILGALLLTSISVATGLPQLAISLPAALFQPAILLGIELATGALLLFGLQTGYKRHCDVSPLLFALLSLGALALQNFGNLPFFLPLLCSIGFLTAGIWGLCIPTPVQKTRTNMPTLDAFLDNTLLPEQTDESTNA